MNNPYFIRRQGLARLWLVAVLLLLGLRLPGLAQTISTVAGDGTIGITGSGIGYTIGVAVDPAGNIYVAGGNTHVIRKVTPGGAYSTFAGTGTAGYAGDGGAATSAQLNNPVDVFVIGNALYIADFNNRYIRKVNLANNVITTVAGDGTTTATGNSTGFPQGVAADASGNIYVAAGNAHIIRKITPGGAYSNFAGTGTAGYAGDGGAATSAQINNPVDVFVSSNALYIAELNNRYIRKVDLSSNIITTVAGDGTTGITGNGIGYPNGVAVDGAGNILVAAGNGQVIRKITPGGVHSTVAGTGTSGFSGDGGPATSAQVASPIDMSALGNDIYIADRDNYRIRKVTNLVVTAPTVTTAAATSVAATSATLGGNVTADGGDAVTTRGVVYSSSNTAPTIGGAGVTQNDNGSGTGTFSESITGLAPGTTYYVQAYATNSAGTSYGGVQTFTTPAVVPTVATTAASSVTSSSAVLGGNVTAANGATVTGRGVVYSVTSTNGTPTIGGSGVTQAANGSGTGSFSATISSLAPGTSYSVQAYATNSAGTSYGGVQTFTTATTTPTVTTAAASSVTSSSAVVGGNVTANGGATVTGRGVVYSVTSTNGTPTIGGTGTTTAPNGSGTGSFSATISSLAPGTSYSVQAYATNSNGTVYGGVQTFTTSANLATVTTAAAGSLTQTSAVLGGNVTADGGGTVTGRGVVYSVTSTNGTPTIGGSGVTQAANGSGTGSFSATISGLAAGTSYSVQAYATNSAGTSYGGVQTFTTNAATATVSSIAQQTPAAATTATATVSYLVTFSAPVSGVTVSNFNLTQTTSGASITSVAPATGPSATYTVAVNTGSGNGTLQLNVANATGITPSVTNTPYSGTSAGYTIVKNFSAAPQLILRGAGSTSGVNDVTAFVDVVQVQQSGTAFTNGLQNGSFEDNNVSPSSFRYASSVVANPWSFSGNSGVSRTGSGFGSTAAVGDAVGLLQTVGSSASSIAQNLAVPTGSYQIGFQAVQRSNNGASDQVVNVFLNNGTTDVFIGSIQPTSNSTYSAFTSATFSVTAPALVATVSTTSASPTSTSPIPFQVSFTAGGVAQSVGTTFTASDLTGTVTGGTLTSGSFSGSGAGPYTFTVTPSGAGTVTVSVAANVANDANNTLNSASNSVSVQYQLPATAAPVLNQPANVADGQPLFTGTAPAGSTVVITVVRSGGGTTTYSTTATGTGAFNYTLTQAQALAIGTYTATATAQTSGSSVSANSNQVTFVVPTAGPTTVLTSTASNPTTVAPIPVQVKFSRNVFNFSASGVTVSNSGGTATVSNFTAVDGMTYTFNVTPSATGLITVNVPAAVAQDSLNRNNQAATALTRQYNQPATAAPVVTAPANNSFTNNANITISGTAPANSTVLIYVLQNGAQISGSPITVTANPSGMFSLGPIPFPDGTYQTYATAQTSGASVSANSNTNTFTVDTTAPTATVSTSSGSPTSTSPIPFTVTFSESVTGFAANKVMVTNGTVSGFTAGAGNTYTFNVTPSGTNTTVTVAVAANQAQDAASNGNTASNSVSVVFQGPTIVVAPASLPGGTQGVAYSTTFSASGGSGGYSYALSGTPPNGLTLTGATLSGTPTASGTYNFRITATDNSVAPGPYSGFRDYTITIATQPVTAAPTVTAPADGSTLATTTPTYTGTAPANSTVTVVVDGSSIGTTTATASGTFSLAQSSALAQGPHTVRATAQSSGATVSPSSSTNTFTVDTVAPTVAISSTAGASGSTTNTTPIPFTVTFSESVTGFTASKVTVTNGTVTTGSFTAASSTAYTFTVTPTTAGTATTVSVAANQAQDAAGNGNTASASAYSITYSAPVTSVGWTGNTSTDWFDASNWNPAQVPSATIDAIVPTAPSGNRFPFIRSGTATARNLSIGSNATVAQDGGTLDVRADLTNNGSFTPTGGTLVLGAGVAVSNILGAGNARFFNLTVGSSGARQSTSAVTSVQQLLTLNGNFNTNANSFVLESNATNTALVVNNNGATSGNVTVQRYLSGPNVGYRHFSPAIGTATVGSLAVPGGFSPEISQGAAYNSSATPGLVTPFPTVYGYDQNRSATVTSNFSTFDKGWVAPTTLGDALTVGKGYAVNLTGGQTFSLSGPLNNGDQNPQTLAYTSGSQGYHLLGNPYPAPLDLSLVAAADRSGLTGSVYTYTSAAQYTGSYSSYLLPANGNPGIGSTSLSGPSSLLPMSQGFFVQVATAGTSGTFTFRNSQRLTSYASPTYNRTQGETRPLAQLTLRPTSGSALADNLYVYFDQYASDGYDTQLDALKLPNPSGLNVSTALASGQNLAIDGRASLGTAQRVVPLAVGVPAPGSYTFTAAQLLNLATTPTYLRDLQTGAVVDLAQQPSYQFTVSNASALLTGRFELVFSPQQVLATASAALAQQVVLYPNPAKGSTSLELPASLGRQAVTATLLDALGRSVRTVVLPAQGAVAHQLDLHELATGVYALRLSTSAGTVVKRLTVE